MRLRSILSLFVALCSPVVVAQTITVGNASVDHQGWASTAGGFGLWRANVTYVDLVHPATASGTLTTASFDFPSWTGTCPGAAKIKFFRRSGDTLTMIAERGPFDGPSYDVALSPPVDVLAGDLIGIVKVPRALEPDYRCGGYFEIWPVDQGEYLAYDFDVTGSVTIPFAKRLPGTLVVSAAGETSVSAEPCSLQTFTGTYAFYEKGSSAIFDPASQPYPGHWAGALAPFVTVGRVTMGPDGAGEGSFWIRVGSLNGGLEPIPVLVTITEMNEDCTGKFTAEFNLAGRPETILERFILFDGGREFRAIPIAGGVETLAWVMEGHRIRKPGELLDSCGPQTAKGKYLWAVENLIRFDTSSPILADSLLLHIDVAMSGDYTGTMYEKVGPVGGVELPVRGTIQVNPDCTFTQELSLMIAGVPFSDPIRGVFFDGGKRAFGLSMNSDAIGLQYSIGEATRIGQ